VSKYERYEREAELRWGHTDAYKESMRRATDYTPEEWEQLRVEGALVEASLLSLMRDGVKPDSVAAMDAAERGIASTSASGSTTAPTRCTAASVRCMSRTGVSIV
jgi:TipAS antibiotic-recognition protein